MLIDLSTVNWLFVVLMAVFAFVAALLGSLIAFRNRCECRLPGRMRGRLTFAPAKLCVAALHD